VLFAVDEEEMVVLRPNDKAQRTGPLGVILSRIPGQPPRRAGSAETPG